MNLVSLTHEDGDVPIYNISGPVSFDAGLFLYPDLENY